VRNSALTVYHFKPERLWQWCAKWVGVLHSTAATYRVGELFFKMNRCFAIPGRLQCIDYANEVRTSITELLIVYRRHMPCSAQLQRQRSSAGCADRQTEVNDPASSG